MSRKAVGITEEYYNNYNQDFSSSSYGGSISNTYKEEDKAVLKQFYRELSRNFIQMRTQIRIPYSKCSY